MSAVEVTDSSVQRYKFDRSDPHTQYFTTARVPDMHDK